ncbi:MAG: serine hydrolase domain-containing protein [Blastomonas sp.]
MGQHSARDFATRSLSRRQFVGSAGLLGLIAAMPMPARAMLAARYPHIQTEIDSYVAQRKVSGMMAAIGFGHGEPDYLTAGHLSLAKITPVDRDSLWRIYSMTKPVTGMAAMILIERGKLSLDQPLADILPKFANMQVQAEPDGSVTDLRPAKNPILIRNLLTHTAGLGYTIIQKGPIKKAYEDAGVVPGVISRKSFPGLDRGASVSSLAEFADNLAGLPLIYEPGTHWSYSVGLDLMGRVIELVSGQPFDAFLQHNIFGPLDMTSTWFQVPESEMARLSTNYFPLGDTLIPVDPGDDSVYFDKPAFPFGGAGLVSSARDYDRFLGMLTGMGQLHGTRIMAEETARLGMSNLLPEGVIIDSPWVVGNGFGAGGRVGLDQDGKLSGTFGWSGAAGTVAFVDTGRGMRAAAYTQYMPSDSYPFQRDFPRLVYADLMGA